MERQPLKRAAVAAALTRLEELQGHLSALPGGQPVLDEPALLGAVLVSLELAEVRDAVLTLAEDMRSLDGAVRNSL